MDSNPSLPSYQFRLAPPSLWTMLRHGVADIASVIPEAILHQPAVQLPGPGAPLIVADPEHAQQVLSERDGRFGRDRLLRRLLKLRVA